MGYIKVKIVKPDALVNQYQRGWFTNSAHCTICPFISYWPSLSNAVNDAITHRSEGCENYLVRTRNRGKNWRAGTQRFGNNGYSS